MSLEARLSALAVRLGQALKQRGLPAGGAAGQVLSKGAAADYVAGWSSLPRSPGGSPGLVSGNWIGQAPYGPLTSNAAIPAGTLRLAPFIYPVGFTASEIGLVTTGTTAGGTNAARLLIYAADAAGWPGELLRSAEVTGLGTAGGKSAVLSSPLAYAAGTVWWVGVHSDAANTLRLVNAQSTPHLGYSSAGDTGTRFTVARTLAYSVGSPSPFNFVPADLSGNIPAEIRLRVA